MVQKSRHIIVKDPLVSIILVNWNGKAHLATCLRSLAAVTYSSKEIILVDNASTDGSVQWVRSKYKNILVIENGTNLGFAGGHDAGLAVAQGKYVLVLNVDTVVEPSFLASLVNRLEGDTHIGVIQPKVLLGSNPHLIDSVGSFFLSTGLLYHYGREKDERLAQYNVSFNIFSAKGVCMLVRREVIDRVGLFDPDYFAYFEETDFCMRVWLAGWRVVYEPSSRITHTGGAASSKQPPAFIVYHASKNVICTYLKNLSWPFAVRAVASMILLYGAWCLVSVSTGKFSVAYALMRAFWWNLMHLGETLRERRRIQWTIRRLPDRSFLPKLTRPVRLRYYFEQFFGSLERYAD